MTEKSRRIRVFPLEFVSCVELVVLPVYNICGVVLGLGLSLCSDVRWVVDLIGPMSDFASISGHVDSMAILRKPTCLSLPGCYMSLLCRYNAAYLERDMKHVISHIQLLPIPSLFKSPPLATGIIRTV